MKNFLKSQLCLFKLTTTNVDVKYSHWHNLWPHKIHINTV